VSQGSGTVILNVIEPLPLPASPDPVAVMTIVCSPILEPSDVSTEKSTCELYSDVVIQSGISAPSYVNALLI